VTLPYVVEAGPSKIEAKILNYFQLPHSDNESGIKYFDSITTELYCDAFGMELTPYTCNHARDIGKDGPNFHRFLGNTSSAIAAGTNEPAAALVTNKGTTSYSVYQQIGAAGLRLGFILPTNKEIQAEKQKERECARKRANGELRLGYNEQNQRIARLSVTL
jgi:hypothetical protein